MKEFDYVGCILVMLYLTCSLINLVEKSRFFLPFDGTYTFQGAGICVD